MPTDAASYTNIAEALRRRMGQQASSAGIPGGAQATQLPSSAVAQMGMNQMQQPAQSASQPQGNPLQTAQGSLNQAANGEAMFILKTFAKRLDKINQ